MRSLIQSFVKARPMARIPPRRVFFSPNRTFTASTRLFNAPEPPKRKLQMTLTCTADNCGHRSTHEFTHHAYTKGIVLITCPGCKNRHLIADHIGWFKDSTEDGKLRTVEDLLRARGEQIKRGSVSEEGVVEYYSEETLKIGEK